MNRLIGCVVFCLILPLAEFAIALTPPDYVSVNGPNGAFGVYQVDALSSDSPFSRTNAILARLGPPDHTGVLYFYARYADGKYQLFMVETVGAVVLLGSIVDSLVWAYPNISGDYDLTYVMCGDRPRILIEGFWVYWVISVNGEPFYGADFEVTNISYTNEGCSQFP